jgi:uncharacterized protein (TIRG00374 family)
MKKIVSWVLRLAVAGGAFLYAVWGVDFATLWASLKQYDPGSLLLTQLYLLALFLPSTFRIMYLTQGRSRLRHAFASVVLCLGLNNILPAKLGELAKVFYLRRKSAIPMAQGLGIMFWERFFDLNALLLIGAGTVYFMQKDLILFPLLLGVGGIWVLLILYGLWPGVVEAMVRILPSERLRLLVRDTLANLRQGFSLRFFVVLGAFTLLAWVTYTSFVLLFFWMVAKFPLTLVQVLSVFVVSSLGMSLPSTPGSLGVYEAAVVLSLGWFGVGKEQALAAALALHMIQYLPTTAGSLLIMMRSGMGWRELRASSESEL